MSVKTLIKTISVTAILATSGGVALAEDGKGAALAKWKTKASRTVSQEMEYPRIPVRRNAPGAHNIVDLRIDGEGRVLQSSLYQSSGSAIFDRASEKFADRIDKLPSLPEAYYPQGAFVRVHLLYARSERELTQLYRTVTRTEQIAQEQEEKADEIVASVPTLNLFAGGN